MNSVIPTWGLHERIIKIGLCISDAQADMLRSQLPGWTIVSDDDSRKEDVPRLYELHPQVGVLEYLGFSDIDLVEEKCRWYVLHSVDENVVALLQVDSDQGGDAMLILPSDCALLPSGLLDWEQLSRS